MDEANSPVLNSAARLHVMLARDVPFAVILRRGPTHQVCSVSWNLSDDTFQVGQWLKGRIYERSCDISPDGQHLLYHAVKHRITDGGWHEYTVLSRAPYLKALRIWFGKGFYGGIWLDNDHFALHKYNYGPQLAPFRVSPYSEIENLPELAQIIDQAQWRLQREGWHLLDEAPPDTLDCGKRSDSWNLTLSIQGNYFAPKRLIYTVYDHKSEETFDCARWQWADFRDRRLLWAQDGKIFAADIWDGGHGSIQQLADFNDWTFEPIVAPY